jgi:proline iminopeptidase
MDSGPLTHAWQVLYPPLQSHDSGWLEVGEGHAIHWETSGHPGGQPALFLHGGPGAGSTPEDRRWFDPQRYRIVQFDQRGCGRSLADDALHANTTAHLVADIEALRLHLGIEKKWLLFGGSWGATLALAYAQQHPQRVRALVLRGVFTARARERRWLYGDQGAALCHPAAWQRLREGAGAAPGEEVVGAMHARLHGPDVPARLRAAHAWWRWEQDLMEAETTRALPQPAPCDDAVALSAARIGVHYERQHYFMPEGQLLLQAETLRDIPGLIVQGTRDLVTPPAAAQGLHRAWPRAVWRSVAAAGHASSHPGMARELIAATDYFAADHTQHHKARGDRHEREGREGREGLFR